MVSKITNAVYWTTNTHLPSQILHVLTPEFRWRTTVLTMHKISVDDTDASINYAGGNWFLALGVLVNGEGEQCTQPRVQGLLLPFASKVLHQSNL